MDIGTVPSYPTGIVTYGEHVYVSAHLPAREEPKEGITEWDEPPRGIFRLSRRPDENGGGATFLTSMSYPRILAVDAEYVWSWDLWLRRAPRAGGPYQRLPFCNPAWLVLNGDEVVVAWDHLISTVDRRCAFTGENEKADGIVTLCEDGWASRVLVHEDWLVYDAREYSDRDGKGVRVLARRRGDGKARVLAEPGQHITELAMIGDDVIIGLADGPFLRVGLRRGRARPIPGTEDMVRYAVYRDRIVDGTGLAALTVDGNIAYFARREKNAGGEYVIRSERL